jgi:biotin carboxyl carrier protein
MAWLYFVLVQSVFVFVGQTLAMVEMKAVMRIQAMVRGRIARRVASAKSG